MQTYLSLLIANIELKIYLKSSHGNQRGYLKLRQELCEKHYFVITLHNQFQFFCNYIRIKKFSDNHVEM